MHTLIALDRYTNKNIQVEQIKTTDFESLKIGDHMVYGLPDPKTGALKNSVGIVVSKQNHPDTESESEEKQRMKGKFEYLLTGEKKAEFEEQQKIALKIFPTFKKEFQAEFPNSVPITARFQIFSEQLYFFFYSEERYVFTEFVKKFKEKLWMNMFLFQVGARDMMRMSPWADMMFCNGDIKLCCKRNMVLPNIEIETVVMQNLEGRDIEKLKGKCWKLKCCLLYELDLYIQESKKYPHKGSKFNICKITNHCKEKNCSAEECQGIVTSFNIITQEVNIKTKEGFLRIPISKLQK